MQKESGSHDVCVTFVLFVGINGERNAPHSLILLPSHLCVCQKALDEVKSRGINKAVFIIGAV